MKKLLCMLMLCVVVAFLCAQSTEVTENYPPTEAVQTTDQKQETPVANEKGNTKKQETPVANEKGNTKKQETPVANEKENTKKQETPVTNEKENTKKQETPVTKEKTTKQEIPVAEQETESNQETPVANEKESTKKQETPVAEQETESNQETPVANEKGNTKKQLYSLNQKGDQYIRISIMVDFPLTPKNLFVGGSGLLGYSYYLTSGFFIGGDVSFGFSATEGNNIFYYIPIMARAGYQFSVGRFEIPLMIGIGGAVETYINRTYFGLAIKPDVGCYFRLNPDWSFGLLTGVWILPQWYNDSSNNRTGILLDLALSVRYHF